MALTLSVAARNAACDAVVDLIDVGATDATGDLTINADSAGAPGTVLATVNLQNPAFGNAASGTATAAGLPLSGTVTTSGTAAWFVVRDRDNTEVFRGTVTATGGGGDMEISNTALTANETVQVNTFDVTMP